MKAPIILSLLLVVVLSACSSPSSRERASGGYEYMQSESRDADLKVPDGLQMPKRSNRYDLPSLKSSNKTNIIGQEVRVSSPRLILPLVNGSHVEEGTQHAKVLFDQVNDNKDLDTTIWDKVLGYLEQNNIGVSSFDRKTNTLVTDWVISVTELDSKWYEITSDYIEHATKFKLSLDLAPHGRTASLSSEIVEYVDQNGNAALTSMDVFSKRNNEVDFLNYIIQEYDIDIRLAQTQRIARIRDGFNTELGFNSADESALIIDASYNNAWPRLLLVLRKMGFDVIDLDQSSGIMFVLYNGEDNGFWSGVFGGNELLLEKGNYRIFVKRAGSKTSVTFKDDENVAFDPTQVTDLFPVFRDYMAADDLDI